MSLLLTARILFSFCLWDAVVRSRGFEVSGSRDLYFASFVRELYTQDTFKTESEGRDGRAVPAKIVPFA